MSKNMMTMAKAYQVAKAIEDNFERLLELDTAQQRADFVAGIVGSPVTVSNFNAAAEAARPGVFVGSRNAPRPPRGAMSEIMREIRELKSRVSNLEAEAGIRQLPFDGGEK